MLNLLWIWEPKMSNMSRIAYSISSTMSSINMNRDPRIKFNLSWIREPKIIKFVKKSREHFKYHELNYHECGA